MLEHFLKILKHHFKINDKAKILLAVSGGLDSMVLAELFIKSGYFCAIAHVNFKLRGNDSESDIQHVAEYAEANRIPFHLHEENAEELAEAEGISIQMAARKIRYDFFRGLLADNNYDFVATAHHADDHFETAVLNLIRGSGYKGLSGIPRINDHIIRPLIHFTRDEILEYAEERNIEWREDTSNSQTKYDRNKVRHKIIPIIKEINPGFIKSFGDTSDQLQLVDMFVEQGLCLAKQNWIIEESESVRIDINYIINHPSDLLLLWEYLKNFGFNFSQFRDIVKSLDSESGKQFGSGKYILERDREFFYLSHLNTGDEDSAIHVTQTDSLICFGSHQMEISLGNGHQKINPNPNEAFLDADKLEYPLTIRNWKDGDRFQPLGMKGQKKLSDFMIDVKIPLNLKRRQKVLLSGGEIVWVLGQRIDHRFRITDKTRKSLHLKIS